MKGICVQELDVLVPCSLVSRDDDETRGKVGIVSHQLAWRAPSRVNLQYLHGCGVKEVEFILEKKEEDREEETEEVIKEEGEGSKRFLWEFEIIGRVNYEPFYNSFLQKRINSRCLKQGGRVYQSPGQAAAWYALVV